MIVVFNQGSSAKSTDVTRKTVLMPRGVGPVTDLNVNIL